jgi:F-box domain
MTSINDLPLEVIRDIVLRRLPDQGNLRDVNRTFRSFVDRWQGPINRLPPELIDKIFSYLDYNDLNTIVETSSKWAEEVYQRILSFRSWNSPLTALQEILEEHLYALVPLAFPRAGFRTYEELWEAFEDAVDDFQSSRFFRLKEITYLMIHEGPYRHPLSDEGRRNRIITARLRVATRDARPYYLTEEEVADALADCSILEEALGSGDPDWVRRILDQQFDRATLDHLKYPLVHVLEALRSVDPINRQVASVVSEFVEGNNYDELNPGEKEETLRELRERTVHDDSDASDSSTYHLST